MYETQHGAQSKVDRHAALTGAPGQHLPAGTDQYGLVYNAATGKWEAQALPGGGTAAPKADPLGLGIPWTVDPDVAGAQMSVGVANRAWWLRVIGGKTGVTKLRINVVTSSGNICAAIYANSGSGASAAPGARLATTGTIPCPAAGVADITLDASVDVSSGSHWFYLAADNTTAQFQSGSTLGVITAGRSGFVDGAYPAPTTAAALTVGNRAFCVLGI